MPEKNACADGLRGNNPIPADHALAETILSLLAQRAPEATICPSEAARLQFPDDWREHMEDTRSAARRLVEAGKIDIVQSGQVVDQSTAKGAIRLRLKH